MVSSTKHNILTAHKTQILYNNKKLLALSFSDVVFITLIIVNMPTFVDIYHLEASDTYEAFFEFAQMNKNNNIIKGKKRKQRKRFTLNIQSATK